LPTENRGSSPDEASGNSAILSMRGEFTDTSGDSSCCRMLMLLRLGVSNTGSGSDALRASRVLLLSTGVLENCWKREKPKFQY
jgi:hypothetical protein